ncbi:unnamed protein product, partial [Rotaria sordida]
FGSTTRTIIKHNGVHYDCGCIISETGELYRFSNRGINENALNIPAVYVAYFATFGALAWHLLLFDTSVQNLNGPILSSGAINAVEEIRFRIAGDSIRAKVCHFVRARLFLAYNFVSLLANADGACIILNHCFEQMAQFTRQHSENLWIIPLLTTLNDQLKAEQEFQARVYYPVYQQLGEYKKFINSLYLQSQIQKQFQDYISQMPAHIQLTHFKTELNNPKYSELSFSILRHVLDSFDFLKMTRMIYHLSQFYFLLHQTYAQLITKDEFAIVSLQELYQRGRKYCNYSDDFQYQNQKDKHLLIIENGIKAVNAYHHFTNGLIRPGACDETQRFTTVTMETPISYLVTSESYDEGDIIMRILSVLIDYHNSLLDLLEKETNTNEEPNAINLIKNLIKELSSREISILQVIHETTGVITLNNNDCLSIERLARASLQTGEEYFPQWNTQFTFNFLYVQSYIIRTYLLFCRINYSHIHRCYQCYTQRQIISDIDKTRSNDNDDTSKIFNDSRFDYLKQMPLGKLYNGYNLLRQITKMLNHSDHESIDVNLYEFTNSIDHDNELYAQLEKYEIQNFELKYIGDVCQLYEKLISNFQYSLINVSHLLCIPINNELNNQLDEILDTTLIKAYYDNKTEQLQSTVRTITEFLNALKEIEDTLLQQSSQSLIQICEYLRIENAIVSLIPSEIECENYVQFAIKLIEIRSRLQEQTIDIEEQNEAKWNDNFNDQSNEQENTENVFRRYFKKDNDITENSEYKDQVDYVEVNNDNTRINIELFQQSNEQNINDDEATFNVNIDDTLSNHLLHVDSNDRDDEYVEEDNASRFRLILDENPVDDLLHSVSQDEEIQHEADNHATASRSDIDRNFSDEQQNLQPIIDTIPTDINDETSNTESTLSLVQENIEYRSLFELNIKSIALTASRLFQKIKPEPGSTSDPVRVLRCDIIHPTSERQKLALRTENFYLKLRTIFEEKRYFDNYVIIDQNQIHVDFLNENNNQSSPRISPEYHIIEKTLLNPIVLTFESKQIEYFATSECQISSVINRFLIDQQLTITSSDIYSFFDEFGMHIDDDEKIIKFYRSNNTNPIQIRIIQCKDNAHNLFEITFRGIENQQQIKAFHPMTKWQQIDLWLKTFENIVDLSVDNYNYWNRQDRIIIDENEIISSTTAQSTSITVDGIDRKQTMKFKISFENNEQTMRTLKSCQVSELLNNRYYFQQLNVNISPIDCILLLIDETDKKILLEEDLQKSIEYYELNTNELVHFQIGILIKIIKYDDNELYSIPISNRNITIEQLLQMIPLNDDIYKYLTSFDTRIIISNDEQFSNINETKFYLVKENETRLLTIIQSSNLAARTKNMYQRYTIFATIADVYKRNQTIITDQYLLFDNDIILSQTTSLMCFQKSSSSIEFKLTNENLKIDMTIIDEEQKDFPINFTCSPSVKIGRLFEIACQLFNVNNKYYSFICSDDTEADDDLSINELYNSTVGIYFKLVSKADAKCSIIYKEKEIRILANNSTIIQEIFEQAIEKFFIPKQRMNLYNLYSLYDPQNPTEIDLTLSIEDILLLFPQTSKIIPLELLKKR